MVSLRRMSKRSHLSTHVIADLFDCQNLNNLGFARRSLKNAASICDATILHIKFYKFSPQGVTGYILLAESHISIHTWPEHNYAAVDVFTCGLMNAERAIRYLAKQFKARKVRIRTLKRGKKASLQYK